MLDANNVNDIAKIAQYGKAKGFLLAKRYGLPTYSNFYIVENEEDIKELLGKFDEQEKFCMRSDIKNGNKRISIDGKNGNRNTIFDYMRKIKEKDDDGVAIIYWNHGKFCISYEVDGAFYCNYRTNENLSVDYIGKGWDGSYLSHGTACHESYMVPWDEVLFLTENNRAKYRKKLVTNKEYEELRKARILDLNESPYYLSIEEAEKVVPQNYSGINNENFRKVVEQVIIPMYDRKDLQRYYKEYIPIAQIENGKVLVPEIILPTRLRYKKTGECDGER